MAVLTTPPVPTRLSKRIWRDLGWEPHELQRAALLDPTRSQAMAAGRRVGKSATGGMKLVPEAYRAWSQLDELRARAVRREYWIVGPEYSDSEKEFRVVWNALDRLGFPMDHPGSYNNPEAGDMHISLFDRRFIISAKSAKYPGTLVGEGLSGVVFSEAAKLKPNVWIKHIRPMLADFEGWAFFGSTPEGKNWFYDLWDIGQNPLRPDWNSWRAPSWANHYLYKGGVDEGLLDQIIEARRKGKMEGIINFLRALDGWAGGAGLSAPRGINPEIWAMFLDMSQEMFNQEIAALFTEFVGRVLKDFDEEIHVTDQDFRSDWETYAAVDYGFTNPFVWLLVQVDPHRERLHILDEYYEVHKTTEEAGAEIAARGLAPSSLRLFYPDPAEPDRTRTLEALLKVRGHKGGSLPKVDRIEWMRRKLKVSPAGLDSDGSPYPALTMHRRCVNTRREFNNWKYREPTRWDPAPEEPEKRDDHTPEALGRLLSGMFGKPWKEAGTRQGRIQVGRTSRPVRRAA